LGGASFSSLKHLWYAGETIVLTSVITRKNIPLRFIFSRVTDVNFVVYGKPEDYIQLSKQVESVMFSESPIIVKTDSRISIEISIDKNEKKLFTSLQNQDNEYFSMDAWKARNILRVIGSKSELEKLHLFLIDLSGRGEGYSYISEYSEPNNYSEASPELRLHVEIT